MPRIKLLCPFANWLHWNLEYSMVCKGLGVYTLSESTQDPKKIRDIQLFVESD